MSPSLGWLQSLWTCRHLDSPDCPALPLPVPPKGCTNLLSSPLTFSSLLTLWFCVYLEGFDIILTSWEILPFFLHFYFAYLFFAPCYLHSFTPFHLKRFSSLLLLSSRSLMQSFWACVKQVTPLLLPVCSNIPRKDEHSGLVLSY